MAIDIDGFGVLKAIASQPTLFTDIKSDVVKSARTLVTKQLKSKALSLEKVKRIVGLLSAKDFYDVLDGWKENELKALAKKLDKNNTQIAGYDTEGARRLIMSLAEGSVIPAQKTAPSVKAPRKASSKKVARAISSEAMAARWDGSNPDKPKK